MKKSLSISLIFLLLISTGGLTINKHFCGGILVSTKINSVLDEKSCCGQDETEDMNCCENETQLIQVDEDYVFSSKPVAFEPIVLTLFYQHFDINFHTKNNNLVPFFSGISPPTIKNISLLFCSLII